VRSAEDSEMWWGLVMNVGERMGKFMKGIKERKKEGEGLSYERNHSSLNLNRTVTGFYKIDIAADTFNKSKNLVG
jgi:hypothetical protein